MHSYSRKHIGPVLQLPTLYPLKAVIEKHLHLLIQGVRLVQELLVRECLATAWSLNIEVVSYYTILWLLGHHQVAFE